MVGEGFKVVLVIYFIFLIFLFFVVVVEYGENFQFLNEYMKLESVETSSWAEALRLSSLVASGAELESIVTLSSILVSLFFWFFVVLVE